MKVKVILALILFAVLTVVGCKPAPREIAKPQYDRPLPPGAPALVKITDPYEIPDFTLACLDLDDLKEAVANSINYMKKPSSKAFFPVQDITHDRALASLKLFAELLDSGLTGEALNQAVREKFDVYMSVGWDGRGTVLFTGYYTPIFDGSFEPTDKFKYPLYKQPPDLVKSSTGEIRGRRMPDGTIRPYPPRAVIENAGMLRGNELVWLADPFEAYIAHVQGSAKVRLPDGKLTTVGYAANNGHEYKSVAEELVKDGRISRSQMSLSAMIDYFKNHIDQVTTYTQRNPRFVFFRTEQGPPRGSLNEPVTRLRTIATDKSIFPRACLAFIATRLPQLADGRIVNRVYSGFALDQDTGGAIRAPGRCDVYMGTGDIAGQLAGRTYQEGKLYYLIAKQQYARSSD